MTAKTITETFKGITIGLRSVLTVCSLLLLSPALVAQYTVGGNASTLGNGCYQLTPASTSKKGYVYYNTPINLNDTIRFKFRVNLGSTNGQGADGIMFVLRDTLVSPFIGSNGGAMGFDASSMDTNSLGIEIDTYQNTNRNDPAADHVAIISDGSNYHNSAKNLAGPVQALAGNTNIEDGNYHTFNVDWNPSTQILKVYLDCNERISYTGDLINDVFDGDAMVYWGFLGTTGGLVNQQRFCLGTPIESVTDSLPPFVDICKGDTVELDAGDNGVNYLWSPGLGLSATNVQDPKAYPSDTTMYTVRRAYQCDTNYDSVLVRVIPPNFDITGTVDDALCKNACNGAVDISVVGGTGNYKFDWNSGQSTEDISGLCDGMYIVTVQDTSLSSPNYLCYKLDTFMVDEPNLLEANIINETTTKCPRSSNCDAEAKGVSNGGGVPPYSFSWTSGENTQEASNLCAGWNFVTITDANGCTAVDSVEIEVPDTIVTKAFGDTMICINSIAAIVASSSGGTPPFSYIWHEGSLNGPVAGISSAEAVSPPVTTRYFVESYDGNGCFGDTSEVLVKVRPPLDVEFLPIDTICPYDTIDITAVGVGGDSIYSFNWAAGGFGPSLTVSPDETRWYAVTITDFCGTPFAVDSLKVQVGGYDDIRPTITVEDDSICARKSVYLIASAIGGYNGPDEYEFTWQHTQSRDNVQFVRPEKTTKYVVKVEDKCLSRPGWDTLVVYVGDTVMPHVKFTPAKACKESLVSMHLSDYNYKNTYHWVIDTFDVFLDYKYDSLNYKFDRKGCYDFDLYINTEFGCESKVSYDCAIEVFPTPKASFVNQPEFPTNVEPMLDFTNTSVSGNELYWVIDFDTIWYDSSFRYEFYERDEPFNVSLFVLNEQGCLDSTSAKISYLEETIIYYPNTFTPNGDDKNEEFLIMSEGVQLQDFELSIHNRWGEQVFFTKRQSQGWDGKSPSGEWMPTGTYYMILKYRNDANIEKVIHDEIHVIFWGDRIGL